MLEHILSRFDFTMEHFWDDVLPIKNLKPSSLFSITNRSLIGHRRGNASWGTWWWAKCLVRWASCWFSWSFRTARRHPRCWPLFSPFFPFFFSPFPAIFFFIYLFKVKCFKIIQYSDCCCPADSRPHLSCRPSSKSFGSGPWESDLRAPRQSRFEEERPCWRPWYLGVLDLNPRLFSWKKNLCMQFPWLDWICFFWNYWNNFISLWLKSSYEFMNSIKH